MIANCSKWKCAPSKQLRFISLSDWRGFLHTKQRRPRVQTLTLSHDNLKSQGSTVNIKVFASLEGVLDEMLGALHDDGWSLSTGDLFPAGRLPSANTKDGAARLASVALRSRIVHPFCFSHKDKTSLNTVLEKKVRVS